MKPDARAGREGEKAGVRHLRESPRRAADGRPVRHLLARRAAVVLKHRRRARRVGDEASVHDLRVATRRLQEALAFCAPALPARAGRRVARRARAIRRGLARVRDADVLVDLTRDLGRRLPRDERRILRDLGCRLRRQARAARAAAGRRGGVRVPKIGKRLRALLRGLAPGGAPLDHGARLVRRRLRAASRALRQARAGGAAALHAFRVSLKRCRYGLEILDEEGMRGLRPALRQVRDLQESLGRLHDLDVLIELVRGEAERAAKRPLLRRLRRRRVLGLAGLRGRLASFRPEAIAATVRRGAGGREAA